MAVSNPSQVFWLHIHRFLPSRIFSLGPVSRTGDPIRGRVAEGGQHGTAEPPDERPQPRLHRRTARRLRLVARTPASQQPLSPNHPPHSQGRHAAADRQPPRGRQQRRRGRSSAAELAAAADWSASGKRRSPAEQQLVSTGTWHSLRFSNVALASVVCGVWAALLPIRFWPAQYTWKKLVFKATPTPLVVGHVTGAPAVSLNSRWRKRFVFDSPRRFKPYSGDILLDATQLRCQSNASTISDASVLHERRHVALYAKHGIGYELATATAAVVIPPAPTS